MVVCKFFLEGRCKFGENCRNQHPRGNRSNLQNRRQNFNENDSYHNNNRQYSNESRRNVMKPSSFGNQQFNYNQSKSERNFSNNTGYPYNNTNTKSSSDFRNNSYKPDNSRFHWSKDSSKTSNSTGETIISKIKEDMLLWGKTKMWPYSCYAHEKEKNCIDNLADISQEELRVLFYLHGKDSYSQIISEIELQYNNVKLELFNMPSDVSSPIGQSLLQQINSPVDTNPSDGLKISVLYGTDHSFKKDGDRTLNILGLPQKLNFSQQNIENMNSQVTTKTNPQLNPSIFGSNFPAATPVPNKPISKQSIFSNAATSTTTSTKLNNVDLTVYREHDKIFPFEMDQFEAIKFDLDKIPMLPPSQELCS